MDVPQPSDEQTLLLIFASFARTVMARANPREVELRMAVE
jgi:hypothetical protein